VTGGGDGPEVMSVPRCCSEVLMRSENKMLASGPTGQVPCREEKKERGACRERAPVRAARCRLAWCAVESVLTRVTYRGGGADSSRGPWRWCGLASRAVEAALTRVEGRGGGADSRRGPWRVLDL